MQCSWASKDVQCQHEGVVSQRARDGEQWAELCEEHDRQLTAAIESGDAKKLMGAYIKAQGGAKKAAARMAPGAQKVVAAIVGAIKP
jgi:hypothetical protein